MTIYAEGDGWRNEDDEGPYTETLRTYYNWNDRLEWQIIRLRMTPNQPGYDLKCLKIGFRKRFDTIEAAKAFVKDYYKC